MSQMLRNQIKMEAQKVASTIATVRMGVVKSYDAAHYAARVAIQPEDILTGWLPVTTAWVGNGWGMFCPPSIGDVVEVHFQEGSQQAPFIVNRFYSTNTPPLSVPSGEFWLVHQSGSYLKLMNDGKIHSNGTWVHTGDLQVTGDIIDQTGSNAHTMQNFRTIYDSHTHGNVQSGGSHTAVPDQTV